MTFPPKILDELLKGYQSPENLLSEGSIFKQLTKALAERCLEGEMKTHLEKQRTEAAPMIAIKRFSMSSPKHTQIVSTFFKSIMGAFTPVTIWLCQRM